MIGQKTRPKLKYIALSIVIVIVLVSAYFGMQPAAPPAPVTTKTSVTTPPAPPKVLTIAMGTEPPTLDPGRCTGMTNLGILRLVTETPLDIHHKTGELLPGLVERWEASPDATTWTLHLVKGIKFHDGTPFNATAIKFTFERLLDPATKAPTRALWQMIESVDVKDTYTAVVNTSPNAAFLKKLNYAPCSIVSPSQVKRLGDKFGGPGEPPAGTGPYKLVEHVRGSHVKLVANDQYWGGRPKIDVIYVKPVAEAGSRLMALEAGTVDFVYAVPPGDIPRLEKNPDLYLIPGKPTRSMYLVLNTQWGPLKDKRVRQALNYALDKETITERLFKGRADVMDCPIPSHSFGYAKVGPYPYDPTKAKQLLKEAGYPDGFEVTLRYGKGRYIMSDEIAEATQSYFAAVGVKTKIEALDWAALSAKNVAPVEKNDNQMVYLGAGNVQLDFDQTMTDFIKAAWPPVGMTPSFYDNPKFDELHQKGASTTDSEKRKAYYKEAFQIMWDDAPNVFLWFEPAIYAARKTVHEAYVRHDETIWLKEAWIDGKASSAAYSLLKLIAVAKKDLN